MFLRCALANRVRRGHPYGGAETGKPTCSGRAGRGARRPLKAGQPALDGYRLYQSWEEGIDDCYRLLLSYARHGAATITVAIPVWAPPADHNDVAAYIASVRGTMGALYAQSAGP